MGLAIKDAPLLAGPKRPRWAVLHSVSTYARQPADKIRCSDTKVREGGADESLSLWNAMDG